MSNAHGRLVLLYSFTMNNKTCKRMGPSGSFLESFKKTLLGSLLTMKPGVPTAGANWVTAG